MEPTTADRHGPTVPPAALQVVMKGLNMDGVFPSAFPGGHGQLLSRLVNQVIAIVVDPIPIRNGAGQEVDSDSWRSFTIAFVLFIKVVSIVGVDQSEDGICAHVVVLEIAEVRVYVKAEVGIFQRRTSRLPEREPIERCVG